MAARRGSRCLGLPRFVFVKSPLETKPLFIDFDSPHAAALPAKLVRGERRHDPEAEVRQHLGDSDHLWLPDARGGRYTSELRLVARNLAE